MNNIDIIVNYYIIKCDNTYTISFEYFIFNGEILSDIFNIIIKEKSIYLYDLTQSYIYKYDKYIGNKCDQFKQNQILYKIQFDNKISKYINSKKNRYKKTYNIIYNLILKNIDLNSLYIKKYNDESYRSFNDITNKNNIRSFYIKDGKLRKITYKLLFYILKKMNIDFDKDIIFISDIFNTATNYNFVNNLI